MVAFLKVLMVRRFRKTYFQRAYLKLYPVLCIIASLLSFTFFVKLSSQELLEVDKGRCRIFQKTIKCKANSSKVCGKALHLEEEKSMQTEEIVCLAKKVRNSIPNVEAYPLATIYTTIKEQEKTNINLPDFKELIYHLTGWDISFQVIRKQLEINQIV